MRNLIDRQIFSVIGMGFGVALALGSLLLGQGSLSTGWAVVGIVIAGAAVWAYPASRQRRARRRSA